MKEEIFKIIQARLAEKPRLLVAVDGMAAAGKSTLAAELAHKFGGEVVHMDDFFLPFSLRTEERLAEAGGNVHYERFSAEAAEPLAAGEPFEYGVFNCSVMEVTERRRISDRGLVIVEGAYCLRPEFRPLYDLKIFIKVEKNTQAERILARSSADKLRDFQQRWIPLEQRYFDELKPEAAADLVFWT